MACSSQAKERSISMGGGDSVANTVGIAVTVNGKSYNVAPEHACMPLLEWLRTHARVKGVKSACGEGGCGACAVMVTRPAAGTGDGAAAAAAASICSINSCLAPVFSVNACHVTTAEGLPLNSSGQNPVTERLAGFHASQCGFCTPGMAVACHTALARAAAAGRAAPAVSDMVAALDGNLCRCTGYRPIIDAAKSFACDVDMEDLGLNVFASEGRQLPQPVEDLAASTAAAGAGAARHQQSLKQCCSAPEAGDRPLPPAAPVEVYKLGSPEEPQLLYVPHTLQQLTQVICQHAGAGVRLVAGNTSAGVYKDWPHDPVLVHITHVHELQRLGEETTQTAGGAMSAAAPVLRIGAAVTLAQVITALDSRAAAQGTADAASTNGVAAAAGKRGINGAVNMDTSTQPEHAANGKGVNGSTAQDSCGVWSGIAAHLKRVAGSHVRGAGTLVGNLVLARERGLPSDVATLLLAAGALVEVVDVPVTKARDTTNGSVITDGALCDPPPTCKPYIVPVADYLAKKTPSSSPPSAPAAAAAPAAEATVTANESAAAAFSLVTAVLLPVPQAPTKFWSTRLASRWANAVSHLNAAAMVACNSAQQAHQHAAAANGDAAHDPVQFQFVLGADLEASAGGHAWRVAHCEMVEQAVQQHMHQALHSSSSNNSSISSSVVPVQHLWQAALRALHTDLKQMGIAAGSSQVANGGHSQPGANGSLENGSTPNGCCEQNGKSSSTFDGDAHAGGGSQDVAAHHAFLRSAAEGVLLQALTALLSDLAISTGTPAAVAPAANTSAHANGSSASTTDDQAAADSAANSGSSSVSSGLGCPARLQTAAPVPAGKQDIPPPEAEYEPMTRALPKAGAPLQAGGTAKYADDIAVKAGGLFGAWVTSTVARGRVVAIDAAAALALPGVVRFVGPQDIPGANVGVPLNYTPSPGDDEPIFATDVKYYGEAVGLVLATSYQAAQRAAHAVAVQYDNSAPPQPPADAAQQGTAQHAQHAASLLTFEAALGAGSMYDLKAKLPQAPPGALPGSIVLQGSGDVEACMSSAPHHAQRVKLQLPSQTHMYMEPQTAVAEPDEDGCVTVHSSTQNLENVQLAVAQALGAKHHKVTVKCRRAGGGFGGKCVQAAKVAAAAAVAASATGCQVRVATNRNTDMAMHGGRPPLDVEFSVGYDDTGKILALDITVRMVGGAYPNVAFVDVYGWRSCLTATYQLGALRCTMAMARCNFPPFSTVRAPGEFEAVLVMESVMDAVAARLGLPGHVVREANMMKQQQGSDMVFDSLGKSLPASQYSLPRIWKELKERSSYDARMSDIQQFNAQHKWIKRGMAMVPCGFPVYTSAKSAIVHVYSDGSVLVCHPGVEIGQGLNTKVLQTAAHELSKALPASCRPLPLDLLRCADPSTSTLPHYSLTAASSASETACEAVRLACVQLVERLTPLGDKLGDAYTWQQLVAQSLNTIMGPGFPPRVVLSAHSHSKGLLDTLVTPPATMFAHHYWTFGAAVAEVEVDVVTGDRHVLAVDLLFDCGRSVNPGIDMGQIEGAFMFGLGRVMSESMEYDPTSGAPTTASTWSYKVPSATCVPHRLNIALLKDSPLVFKGPVGAKAVGEPPLLLSSAVHCALQSAARAAAAQTFGLSSEEAAAVQLAFPATVPAVKAACGTRSLLDVISAA